MGHLPHVSVHSWYIVGGVMISVDICWGSMTKSYKLDGYSLVFLVRLLDYIVLEVLLIVKNLGFFQKQHLRL
ncbi:Uncharacterised protein [Streptococcus pneumoniae]|nr:Uncharacterised protein [Streptococcus pneumoniae]